MTRYLQTIAELAGLPVSPQERRRRKPVVRPLDAPVCLPDTAKLPRKFACKVFCFRLSRPVEYPSQQAR